MCICSPSYTNMFVRGKLICLLKPQRELPILYPTTRSSHPHIRVLWLTGKLWLPGSSFPYVPPAEEYLNPV